MGSLCTTAHEGAHRLMWNVPTGGDDELIRELVGRAIYHAPGATDADLAAVTAIVRRARVGRTLRAVEVSDDEYATIREVVEDAADYMVSNGYADDPDFGEDQRTAQALGDGRIALVCWTGRA